VGIRGFRPAALHTLAGAYALDALDDADRARFERHLARCDVCAQEVRGLRETTALLGAAVAAQPPQRMRAQVLAAAARIRQHPPAYATDEHQRRSRLGWPRPRAWPGGKGQRGWLARVAIFIAAGSLVGAVTLGVMAVGAQHRLDRADERNREVAAVLTARDAVMMTAPVRTGGTASVVMSHAKHMIVFSARGLHPLSGARSYELWLIGPQGVRPAGMLPPLSNGMTAPMVAAGVGAGDKVGMTVEPARGSARPTTPPVLVLPLPD
jgi:anti-sigma-K factor RskA